MWPFKVRCKERGFFDDHVCSPTTLLHIITLNRAVDGASSRQIFVSLRRRHHNVSKGTKYLSGFGSKALLNRCTLNKGWSEIQCSTVNTQLQYEPRSLSVCMLSFAYPSSSLEGIEESELVERVVLLLECPQSIQAPALISIQRLDRFITVRVIQISREITTWTITSMQGCPEPSGEVQGNSVRDRRARVDRVERPAWGKYCVSSGQ